MDEASRLFDQYARPEAKKVLVIITDKRSDSTLSDIRDAAKILVSKSITVIPVAFGRDADPNQLVTTTPNKGDLIKKEKTVPPKTLAKEIMDKILEGNFIQDYAPFIRSVVRLFTRLYTGFSIFMLIDFLCIVLRLSTAENG
jgi:hypothetical protein